MRADPPSPRFPEIVRCRAPRGLQAAIAAAAARRHQSPGELVRQALLARIEEEGMRLTVDGRIEELRP
jgi:hypothetical protein